MGLLKCRFKALLRGPERLQWATKDKKYAYKTEKIQSTCTRLLKASSSRQGDIVQKVIAGDVWIVQKRL